MNAVLDAVAVLLWVLVILLALLVVVVLVWGYHEWWVSQHCVTVLGSLVCQLPIASPIGGAMANRWQRDSVLP